MCARHTWKSKWRVTKLQTHIDTHSPQYLDMYNIYVQLGYLVKAEMSVAICLPPQKTNEENATQQTSSETNPLVLNIHQLCKLQMNHGRKRIPELPGKLLEEQNSSVHCPRVKEPQVSQHTSSGLRCFHHIGIFGWTVWLPPPSVFILGPPPWGSNGYILRMALHKGRENFPLPSPSNRKRFMREWLKN